jgi:hypothetical protein
MSEQDRLYELLPVVLRQRDAEQGYPLRGLLQVIEEQADDVERDIKQLYENWFIETCQDWVVPYIGDLVGYQPIHEAGEPGEVTTPQGLQRNKILIPRKRGGKYYPLPPPQRHTLPLGADLPGCFWLASQKCGVLQAALFLPFLKSSGAAKWPNCGYCGLTFQPGLESAEWALR